jgi:tetratricopeptide (TPR) repeat protein
MNSTAAEVKSEKNPESERALASPGWAEWLMRPAVLLRATFLLTLLIYLRTITFDWVFDDHVQVVLNPWLSSWSSVKQMFTLHSWAFSDYGFAGKFYRPLFLVWLLVNNKLFHGLPGWFHLAGIGLHVAVVYLAYLTARRLLKEDRLAGIAVLLFALHPTKVESVAWVAGLTEPLLALFFFGCVLAYLRWQQTGCSETRWLAISTVCFAGAIFSKETAVFAPLLIAMHYWFAEEGHDGRVRGTAYLALPYFGIGLAYWLIRLKVMSGIAQLSGSLSIAKTIYTVPIAFLWYVRHTVWPFGLSLLYPEMIVKSPSLGRFVLPLAGLLMLAGGFLWLVRKSHTMLLMVAWAFLTILPPVGAILLIQPHDRYLYLPSFGIAVIVAELLGRWNLKISTLAAIVLVIAIPFAVTSFRTTTYWEDDLHIFERGMEVAPDNPAARTFYAGALMGNGEKKKAFAIMLEGIRLRPDSANLTLQLAQMYESSEKPDEARRLYERTLMLNADARFIGMCHYSLGNLAQKQGNYSETEVEFRKAIAASPTAAGYHQALGIVLRRQGRETEARQEFQQEEQIRLLRTRNF